MTTPPRDSHFKSAAMALRVAALLILINGVLGMAAGDIHSFTRTAVITFLRYAFPDPRSAWSLVPGAASMLAALALFLSSCNLLSRPRLLWPLSLLVFLDFVALQLVFGILEPAHGLLFFFLIRPLLPPAPTVLSKAGC